MTLSIKFTLHPTYKMRKYQQKRNCFVNHMDLLPKIIKGTLKHKDTVSSLYPGSLFVVSQFCRFCSANLFAVSASLLAVKNCQSISSVPFLFLCRILSALKIWHKSLIAIRPFFDTGLIYLVKVLTMWV